TSLGNACPLENPIAVASERRQVLIGNHLFRNVAPASTHLDSRELRHAAASAQGRAGSGPAARIAGFHGNWHALLFPHRPAFIFSMSWRRILQDTRGATKAKHEPISRFYSRSPGGVVAAAWNAPRRIHPIGGGGPPG